MKKKKKGLSQLSAAYILPLAVSQSPPSAPRMPSNSAGVSGPAVGQPGLSSSPAAACSCLRSPWLPELLSFLLRELSLSFYIFNRHRVCLVDRVDLICSLYSWWEGFLASSLATLPLVFSWFSGVLLHPPLPVCCRPLEFPPEAALEDLGLP